MTTSRLTTGLAAACSAALVAPLLGPLLTGRIFVYNDLTWFHLPLRYLYQQALRSGDTVLWTPSIFSGLYLHGEGQAGLFHPWHQLLYRALPLGAAFNLELVASYPASFAGMVWFLRRLRFSRPAALFGAMLFAFSGFALLHHHHVNMVAIVAHLPWLLAAADVAIVDERPRSSGPRSSSASRRRSGGTCWRSAPSACSAPARRAGGGGCCPARPPAGSASCWAPSSGCRRSTPPRGRCGWGWPAISRSPSRCTRTT
jgi:hypothetical protein